MPDALDDQHLLLVSEQLRDLLAGKGWDDNQGPGSAALPITLLLLSEAGAERLFPQFRSAQKHHAVHFGRFESCAAKGHYARRYLSALLDESVKHHRLRPADTAREAAA